mgnify:CR=1 FL=1
MVSLRKPSAVPVVGVLADRRTYANLAYLLVTIPLGLGYSMALTFWVVFGTLLSVVGVGIAILFATLIGSWLLAGVERRLANSVAPLVNARNSSAASVKSSSTRSPVSGFVNAMSPNCSLGSVCSSCR